MRIAENQAAFVQFVQGDRVFFCQGVVTCCHAHHRRFDQFHISACFFLFFILPEAQHHIQGFLLQKVSQGLRGDHLNVRMHLGICLGQPPQRLREHSQFKRAVASYDKRLYLIFKMSGKSVFGLGCLCQDIPGVSEKNPSRGRELHCPGGPLEQFDIQFGFQRIDLMGYGGLCYMKLFGGSGKVQVLRHCHIAF